MVCDQGLFGPGVPGDLAVTGRQSVGSILAASRLCIAYRGTGHKNPPRRPSQPAGFSIERALGKASNDGEKQVGIKFRCKQREQRTRTKNEGSDFERNHFFKSSLKLTNKFRADAAHR
jgi:hypothetical protein